MITIALFHILMTWPSLAPLDIKAFVSMVAHPTAMTINSKYSTKI